MDAFGGKCPEVSSIHAKLVRNERLAHADRPLDPFLDSWRHEF